SQAQAHNNGKAQGSRAQHRRNARSGQGIIEANRKTAICKHWLQGVCPFGARCAFAHGAKELKDATAKPPPPPEMGKAKHLQSSTSRDATTSYSDPRCTIPPGAFSDGESWLLEAKSPVTDQGSRDADGHCHRGVWLETRGHSAGSNDPYLRGTLRENESWAKIAQGKPIHGRESDGARASNVTAASTTTTTTTTTTPPDFYGDELRRSAFRETKAHAAGPAPCSSGVVCCCRTRSSRDTPRAFGCVASVAPGPTFSTTGLAFSPRGCTSPAPLNLGPLSALQRTSTAAPAAAHRCNPINYNGSAFGGSFASSLQENAEARKPSPSPAPIPRHGMDDFLGRMMSVLSLDASRSNDDDASRDVGPSVPQSWYDPFLLRPVEEKEPARLKTAQQPGGPSGDSSRLDQSYRSDSLGKSLAPGKDSKGTSTTSGDAFSIPSIGSILDEKWPTALPAGGALKPSSMAPSTRVHNDVLTNPGGSFSHSLWSCSAVHMRWLDFLLEG
ncbi:unnamed protein product, partial [Ectocarpus sp. 4 AP-2014]